MYSIMILFKYNEKGMVKLKKRLSLCMMILLGSGFAAAETSAQDFKDVPKSHQFYEEITELSEQGVINGYSDNTFRPGDPLTRGQAAKILSRIMKLNTDEAADVYFKDVPKTHQYYDDIAALKSLNILNGFEDDTFRPSVALQRHHVAKMLSTAFVLMPHYNTDFRFSDVPDNYQYYVMSLYDNNITKGKTSTTFDGRSSITRGQMAALLFRAKEAANLRSIVIRKNENSNESPLYDVDWEETHYDAIYATKDKTLTVVEANDDIEITTYDEKFDVIGTKNIPLELPMFGAFYHGKNYNYIAFGQKNSDEKNIEVIRIVRYDHDFNKLSSVSISGDASLTAVPFEGSSGGQMAESADGNTLVYHTSRGLYDSETGGQSQLTIEIDTQTMTVKNKLDGKQWNNVQLSFGQYVMFDGNEPVYVDHGTTSPRNIVLQKKSHGTASKQAKVNIHTIQGELDSLFTGVTIGSVTQSKTHYLVSYNAVSPLHYALTKDVGLTNRNVHVVAVNKQTLEATLALEDYFLKSQVFVTPPKLVKINDDKFLVLWQEYIYDEMYGHVYGRYVNGKGEFISERIAYPNTYLSQAQPIVFNNEIIWNESLQNATVLYSIPIDKSIQ